MSLLVASVVPRPHTNMSRNNDRRNARRQNNGGWQQTSSTNKVAAKATTMAGGEDPTQLTAVESFLRKGSSNRLSDTAAARHDQADVPYSGLRKGGLLHRHPRQHATKIRCQGPVAGPPLPHSALSHIQHRHGTCPPSSPSQTQQQHQQRKRRPRAPLPHSLSFPLFSLSPPAEIAK